jgi:hypothetical protein
MPRARRRRSLVFFIGIDLGEQPCQQQKNIFNESIGNLIPSIPWLILSILLEATQATIFDKRVRANSP